MKNTLYFLVSFLILAGCAVLQLAYVSFLDSVFFDEADSSLVNESPEQENVRLKARIAELEFEAGDAAYCSEAAEAVLDSIGGIVLGGRETDIVVLQQKVAAELELRPEDCAVSYSLMASQF